MNYYLLFKSLHLISVISWMAGLLYLPRLFVYHAQTTNNEKMKETFNYKLKYPTYAEGLKYIYNNFI